MRPQKYRELLTTRAFIAVVTLACAGWIAWGELPSTARAAESPAKRSRRTPLVELVQRVEASAVDILNVDGAGSGFVLHASGYIITNRHVVRDGRWSRVSLYDGTTYHYRIIAQSHLADLALIKIDAPNPLEPVRLGRSHDLMLGEDVLAIGNATGLRHSIASGVITGLARDVGVGSDPQTIQTDAAINPGNSGGPLFNTLGELIGVVAQSGGENIGFAIRVDRLREVFPEMMSPEQRFELVLGMEVDTLNDPPKVREVAADSPAHAAGVQVGDEVVRVGDSAVRHGLDVYLSFAQCKAGEPLSLKLKRAGKVISTKLTPRAFHPPEPVKLEGLRHGLQFDAYDCDIGKLPDFDKLEPVASGICRSFSQQVYPEKAGVAPELYALRLSGFVEVPSDGLYFFYTNSDDASRLYIGDQLVVNNDGLHAARERSGQIRLKAGLQPITVTFYQDTMDTLLEVFYEGPSLEKREIPAEALFFQP